MLTLPCLMQYLIRLTGAAGDHRRACCLFYFLVDFIDGVSAVGGIVNPRPEN